MRLQAARIDWSRPVTEDSGDSAVAIRPILAALSGLAVILVLVCTSRYGVGLSQDSANYLSAARSLLAGEGYRYCDGGVYTHWPPLFPTLLAALGLAGVEPQTGARFINALAFGATVLVSGRLFLTCTRSKAFAVLGTVSILLSVPLLMLSTMAMSEPVFILLSVLFVRCLAGFLSTKRRSLLVAASVLAALAGLQRYAGVTLILTGGVLVALYPFGATLWARARYTAVFGVIACSPLAAWIVRNRVVTGETAGAHTIRLASGAEFVRSATAAADVVARWLSPRWPSVTGTLVGLGLVLLVAGVVIVISRVILRNSHAAGSSLQIAVATVFASIYCGFVIASGAAIGWNPNERVMLPAYIFLMLIVFTSVADAARWLAVSPTGRKWAGPLGLLLCLLWLAYPLAQTGKFSVLCLREGAGEFRWPTWQGSPMMQWLREHPLQGDVCSNAPSQVYLLTGTPAKCSPHYYHDLSQFAAKMSSSPAAYIVWVDHVHLDFLYDAVELASRWRMTKVATFSDGAVYRFLGDGDGPPVWGVHRFWSSREGRHYYTLDKHQIEVVGLYQADLWYDEGPVFYVYSQEQHPAETRPVYMFCLHGRGNPLYTMDEAEKETLVREYASVWSYEGVAWYAYPEGRRPVEARPVYRLWCDRLQVHLYTVSESEMDRLVRDRPETWTFEGIAWYAYGK